MKVPLYRFHHSTIQRIHGVIIRRAILLLLLNGLLPGLAQAPLDRKNTTRSISGQFIATGPAQFSQLAGTPRIAADTNFVRLGPALLAVSAERIKDSLYRQLGIPQVGRWRSQIYLTVHPARSLDENVTIVSRMTPGGFTYWVDLPDVLPRRSFTRALTGVVLLEFANRNARAHSAEIPAWLTDGLSEEMLAAGAPEIILSVPDKVVNGLPLGQINATQRSMDTLSQARHVLEKFPPLTHEQLTWPTAAQQAGDDGGAYRASAQLFVRKLLKLKNGSRQLRAMLESLPQFYNWQTAIQSAFHDEFPRPLDLEKWWELQLTGFAAHDHGTSWTLAASRAKLDEILSVSVEMRLASNSLPARAQISLQSVIRSLDPPRRNEILRDRLLDLEFAQFRIAPQLAAITDDYRRTLAGCLGELPAPAPGQPRARSASAARKKIGTAETLQRLDALDAERRNLESTLKPQYSP